ncbi:hypothetical protein EWM64_g8541 [Hericium alpestre]|uniref:DNA 3'-5' helicase n=1 Tax=Hericium alpestre TaxID=135208 RepID=A0A4Y9ZNP9_9AGAM|nr:hypothetical protein EWM64_g8541 [Hericium alpestre]
MITVIVEPTNALENNMASKLKNKGLTAIVINAEKIEEAKTKSRNLWDEAKSGQYQIITLSPEMLKSQEYSVLNNDPYFRQHWCILVVDKAHLVDHWGTDFRKAYADIWALRSHGPEHLTLVAMSASMERGGQMTQILQRLGYRENAFHLDKRDCQCHNVDLIFRTVQFTSTGFEFHDLDWLVPEDLASASDVPKCIVYSDTIETGHRITVYLQGLLPSHLQSSGTNLVCHMHSMNCLKCKKEGLAALNATNSECTTAIFMATAVWEVGLDVPDIDSVVLFPAPASTSSIVQRAECPACTPGMHGEAFIYVKKTDIEAALEYARCDPPDSHLLNSKNLANRPSGTQEGSESQPITDDVASEVDGQNVASKGQETAAKGGNARDVNVHNNDTAVVQAGAVEVEFQNAHAAHGTVSPSTIKPPKKMMAGVKLKGNGKSTKVVGKKKTADLLYSEQGKCPCFAHYLIITAHARGLCIARQINIVYDNPATDHDCGRCSSCLPHPLPAPRPMPTPIPDIAESTTPPSDNALDAANLPSYMKLT